MARLTVEELRDWEFADVDEELREWTLIDQYGNTIGQVAALEIDADSGEIRSVLLDNGIEYSASEIEIQDGAIRLQDPRKTAETADHLPRMRRLHHFGGGGV